MKISKKKFLFPLRKQFFFIIILMTVCVTLIASFTCARYKKVHASVVQENMEIYFSQLSRSVNEMYTTCRNIAYSLSYSQIIQSYLSAQTSVEKYNVYSLSYNQLTTMMDLSSYIMDIALIANNGNTIAVYGTQETYMPLDAASLKERKSLSSLGRAFVKNKECQILGMPVYSLNNRDISRIGTLFLAIDIDGFFLDNSADVNYIPGYVLSDSRGEIIYGEALFSEAIFSSGENPAKITVGSSDFQVKQYPLSAADSNFYMLIDNDVFVAAGNRIATLQLTCMMILLVIFTLIMFHIYRPLIHSLQKLTLFMKNVAQDKQKNYKDGIQIDQGILGSSEISEITNSLNEMLHHTYELNHKIFENYTHMYEMDINNTKTEIAYLRSQINPHFLYNTLTMVCGMAAAGNTPEIIDTVSSLFQIFRYSIKGNDMVTLEEEMDIVHSYLRIQSYRFGDRFSVRYELSEESLRCLIPRMVIQPLVENAIIHGLEPSRHPGELLIGSGKNPEHGYLAIWIFDTGVGMDAKKRDEIRDAIRRPVHSSDTIMDSYRDMDSQNHDSIGLLNVNTRMVLYFGSDYSLILDSELGVGTNIQLRIPYQTAAQQTHTPEERQNYVSGNHH